MEEVPSALQLADQLSRDNMEEVPDALQLGEQLSRATVSGDAADLPDEVLQRRISHALGTIDRTRVRATLRTAADHGSTDVLGRLLVCFPPASCPEVDVLVEAVGQHRVAMLREARSFVLNRAGIVESLEPTRDAPHVATLLRAAWAPLEFAAQGGCLDIMEDVMQSMEADARALGVASCPHIVVPIILSCLEDAMTSACREGKLHMLIYLVETPVMYGGDAIVLSPNFDNNLLLREACAMRQLPVIQYLCSLPCIDPSVNGSVVLENVCAVTSDGIDLPSSVFGHGVRKVGTAAEVLEFLLDLPSPRGVNPAAFDNIVLRTAVTLPNGLRLVRRLCELPLSVGIDPAVHANAPLRYAAAAHRVDIVRYLCELPRERGVDPSANDNEALMVAAVGPGWELRRVGARIGDSLDIVRYLCNLPADRGVDPSAIDNNIIRFAFHSDQHEALVRFMCSLPPHCGVDPAADDNTPLLYAMEAENESLVTFLLSFPAVRACPIPLCLRKNDLTASMPRRLAAAASRAERRDSCLPLLLLASLCASGRAKHDAARRAEV